MATVVVVKLLLALVFYSFNFSRVAKTKSTTTATITTTTATKHTKGKSNKENHWHERTTWRRYILAIMTFQLVVWPKFFPILHFEIISTLYVRACHIFATIEDQNQLNAKPKQHFPKSCKVISECFSSSTWTFVDHWPIFTNIIIMYIVRAYVECGIHHLP